MKKQWIKLFATLFVCATLALGFTACKDEENNSSNSGGTNTEQSSSDSSSNSSDNNSGDASNEQTHTHNYTAVTTAPTCTAQGFTTYTCVCGENYIDTYIKANGHTEVIDYAVAPTCTKTGLTEGKHCSICKETLIAQTVVKADGHNFITEIIDPTCTERGFTMHSCSCGEKYTDTYQSALDHEFTIYISDNNATYEQDGTKTAKCNRIGCNETNTITDTGSILTEKFIVEFDSKGGSAVESQMIIKGEKVVEPEIPQREDYIFLGWYLKDEKWSFVGYSVTESITLVAKWEHKLFKISGNSIVDITDYCKENKTILNIPSEIDGILINAIGNYAFSGYTNLLSLRIPNSITSIGDGAFFNCKNIKNAIIPAFAITYIPVDNLETIEITSGGTIPANAFYGCKNLTTAIIGNDITLIGTSAFYQCTSLAHVTIGDSVTIISEKAFFGCTSLKNITLGNSVKTIEVNAFYQCKSLESLTIPQSVNRIEMFAFVYCCNLKSVTFERISGWFYTHNSLATSGETIPESILLDKEMAAANLVSTDYMWKCV